MLFCTTCSPTTSLGVGLSLLHHCATQNVNSLEKFIILYLIPCPFFFFFFYTRTGLVSIYLSMAWHMYMYVDMPSSFSLACVFPAPGCLPCDHCHSVLCAFRKIQRLSAKCLKLKGVITSRPPCGTLTRLVWHGTPCQRRVTYDIIINCLACVVAVSLIIHAWLHTKRILQSVPLCSFF